MKPLIVYFHKQPTFNYSRRVYIAARSKAQAHRISGISTEQLGYGQSIEAGTGWAPAFIKDEGVWLEIRDHEEEGHLYADKFCAYGEDLFRPIRMRASTSRTPGNGILPALPSAWSGASTPSPGASSSMTPPGSQPKPSRRDAPVQNGEPQMKITYTCMCQGMPAPGSMCGHVIVSNKNLCGYKGDGFCEFRREGCAECGAKTQEEAETKCLCAGDKDDCHGCRVWPD